MNVLSKRNIILPGPNGEKFRMTKGYEGPVPAWAEKSEYLKALAKDKKVSILGARKGSQKPPADLPKEPGGGGEE